MFYFIVLQLSYLCLLAYQCVRSHARTRGFHAAIYFYSVGIVDAVDDTGAIPITDSSGLADALANSI